MKKVLVTGATGFLGQHLIKRLLQENISVRALYRDEKKIAAIPLPLGKRLGDGLEWIKGDVLDIFSLEDAMKDCEEVYHCAAVVSFSKKDEARMMKTNVEGTANVVNECVTAGVKKLLHVSSVASLGRTETSKLISEKHKWEDNKLNTRYAVSKHKAEMEVWRGVAEGLNAVVIYPTMIFGPGDWNENTSKLFQTVFKGLKFYPVGGNGMSDVRDVCDIAFQLMQSEIVNERFVVCGTNWTYKDFFFEVADALGKPRPTIKLNPSTAIIGARVLSLLSLFGKEPLVTVESARTSSNTFFYDGAKVSQALNFKYRDFNDTIKWVSGELLNHHSKFQNNS